MNRNKVYLIIALLLITIVCLLYFRPLLSSHVKNEAIDYTKKMNFTVIVDEFQSEYCCYLDSDETYDYYCVLEYEPNSSEAISTYLLKLYGNTVIKKYCLSDLNCGSLAYVQRGIYNNNYLYFVIRGVNTIYRIDTSFILCEPYVEKSQYGDLSYSSLSFCGGDLLYITNNGNIVKYSNGNEKLFLTVPELESVFGGEKIDYNVVCSQYNTAKTTNYVFCTNGKETFCAASNRLFLCNNKNGKSKGKEIKLPYDVTYIEKISFSKENNNLLFIYYVNYVGPWEPQNNRLVILNTETGQQRKFEQADKYKRRSWKTPETELCLSL